MRNGSFVCNQFLCLSLYSIIILSHPPTHLYQSADDVYCRLRISSFLFTCSLLGPVLFRRIGKGQTGRQSVQKQRAASCWVGFCCCSYAAPAATTATTSVAAIRHRHIKFLYFRPFTCTCVIIHTESVFKAKKKIETQKNPANFFLAHSACPPQSTRRLDRFISGK